MWYMEFSMLSPVFTTRYRCLQFIPLWFVCTTLHCIILTLYSQDLISNSLLFLPYSSCDVSLKNLVLDQLIIPSLIFFYILITCLLDIVLLLWEEIVLVTHGSWRVTCFSSLQWGWAMPAENLGLYGTEIN